MTATDRPLRRDAQRNRARILAAAHEVFAGQGLGASLDQVAERAGVGVGTVYRRFPTKDGLIDALFEERIAAIGDRAREALAAEDAWEGFLAFLWDYVTQVAGDRGLKQVLIARGDERVRRARAQLIPDVGRLIARAQADGRLRDDLTVNDVGAIALMVSEIAELAGTDSDGPWRRALQLVIDGIVRAREAPTPLTDAPAPAGQLADALLRRAARRAPRISEPD